MQCSSMTGMPQTQGHAWPPEGAAEGEGCGALQHRHILRWQADRQCFGSCTVVQGYCLAAHPELVPAGRLLTRCSTWSSARPAAETGSWAFHKTHILVSDSPARAAALKIIKT